MPHHLTYADQWQGHTGAIYRASNWEYLGLTQPEPTFVDEESGRLVARKAGPTTRTHGQMEALGDARIGSFAKHKYRLILPRARPPVPRTLFDALRAPPGAADPQRPSAGRRSTQPGTQDTGQDT